MPLETCASTAAARSYLQTNLTQKTGDNVRDMSSLLHGVYDAVSDLANVNKCLLVPTACKIALDFSVVMVGGRGFVLLCYAVDGRYLVVKRREAVRGNLEEIDSFFAEIAKITEEIVDGVSARGGG